MSSAVIPRIYCSDPLFHKDKLRACRSTACAKGTNGRWRDTLPADRVAAYEARALAKLGPDCARWLKQGGSPE